MIITGIRSRPAGLPLRPPDAWPPHMAALALITPANCGNAINPLFRKQLPEHGDTGAVRMVVRAISRFGIVAPSATDRREGFRQSRSRTGLDVPVRGDGVQGTSHGEGGNRTGRLVTDGNAARHRRDAAQQDGGTSRQGLAGCLRTPGTGGGKQGPLAGTKRHDEPGIRPP